MRVNCSTMVELSPYRPKYRVWVQLLLLAPAERKWQNSVIYNGKVDTPDDKARVLSSYYSLLSYIRNIIISIVVMSKLIIPQSTLFRSQSWLRVNCSTMIELSPHHRSRGFESSYCCWHQKTENSKTVLIIMKKLILQMMMWEFYCCTTAYSQPPLAPK